MKLLSQTSATCVCLSLLGVFNPASAIPVNNQGTWKTTLLARDLDGDTATIEAYYDTALEITWLKNANYSGDQMNWFAAKDWAADLDINGFDDWRLPTVTDTGNDGCNFAYTGTDCGYNVDTSTGEMAHMYYITLGNLAHYDTAGNEIVPGVNTGPFSNLLPDRYWTATKDVNGDRGWYFGFLGGHQRVASRTNKNYAWAVHNGDIGSPVPIPAAIWLFGLRSSGHGQDGKTQESVTSQILINSNGP